ncbi:MAG TPA: AAA family ATPase [Thermomicrobiales bacterium]|jgi:tetratricopeptide (TPR) repeat protein
MADAAPQPDLAAPYVFVSYASADRERVMPVVAALRGAGVPVWLDQQGIAGGENYAAEINDAIQHCAALVLMCSAASLASRNVKQEIALGWEYERPYVPLLLEPVTIPGDVKYWLTAAQWIEVLGNVEAVWLPSVLDALAPLGIVPKSADGEEIRLAGREKELALLRDKLAAAKEGKGGLVLIGGEAGIGKTTLAEAALHEAARTGFVMLEGHCFDLAETPPYGPWIDLFAHYVPSPAAPPLPEPFARRGTFGVVSSQMALFIAVEDFLSALAARQSVVLLLDDLHWSDPASLDLLRFLVRSVTTRRLLILVTYRSDELTRRHPLYTLLPQLARETGTDRFDLGRLDDDAVRTIARERYDLPDDDLARLVTYLQGRAEGNALFIGELLRALEEGGTLERREDGWRLGELAPTTVPQLLRQVIGGRVARLDEGAQEALGAAAVIGQEVPFAVWAVVAAVDEDDLAGITEHAATARLMEETAEGTGGRFLHALVREALYEGLLPSRRRRLHRAAGEALAALPDPDADAVAHHFRIIGDARAAAWLARAGERARAAHAYATAVERMQEAIALLDKPEDAAMAASLCVQISYLLGLSDREQAIRYAEEAIKRAEEADDPVLAGVARCRLGLALMHDQDFARGIVELRQAVAELEALPPVAWQRTATPRWFIAAMDGDRASVTDVRTSLAFPLAIVGAFGEALALIGGTLDIDDAWLATANEDKLATLCIIGEYLGRPDVAKRAFAEFGRLAGAKEDWYTLGSQAFHFFVRTVLTHHADDLAYREGVARAMEAAWGRAQALHAVAPFPVRAVCFPLDFIAGAWEAAQTYAPMVESLSGPFGHTAAMTLGAIARAQGRPEGAWRYVRQWLPEGAATEPGAHPLIYGLALLSLGGLLALDAGDLDGAREWAEASDRWLAWSGAVRGQSEGQALWAQYYRQSGDTDQARVHAERALAHATEPRQPLALLAAHRLLGELDTDAGRYDDAETHLQSSLALADACASPYERALTLLAVAELKAATGDRDAATLLLNEIQAICTPLGAKPALARAAALTARLG